MHDIDDCPLHLITIGLTFELVQRPHRSKTLSEKSQRNLSRPKSARSNNCRGDIAKRDCPTGKPKEKNIKAVVFLNII
jgi:hypothetical protein